mmetsp:Transcript_47078/g.102431  ORF Transcript_47078/g.102431 Transcript_47078/m.102431 type:complete len:374 (+) Transcript_47078:42-1163(+)
MPGKDLRAKRRWHRANVATGLLLALTPRDVASGGITEHERILHSDGQWHRGQRKRITFETSCSYTYEPELPRGCEHIALNTTWLAAPAREERGVLLSLYQDTGGAMGYWRVTDNWGEGDPCIDMWYGVTCDEHGRIISLELADNGMVGQLPPSLGSLTSLLRLDVATSAPDWHGHENLYANRLAGALPSFAAARSLEELEISGNGFTSFPDDLYLNAGSLRVLSASHNAISDFPLYLGRFRRLHTLELGHNRLSGSFPAEMGALTSLRFLHLDYNDLSGALPPAVAGMSKIRAFDVSHNPRLSGELPENIIVEWAENDYVAILNTSMSGFIASLCLDVPFCRRYMYDTHKDLTWASAADVPDIVNYTVGLASF